MQHTTYNAIDGRRETKDTTRQSQGRRMRNSVVLHLWMRVVCYVFCGVVACLLTLPVRFSFSFAFACAFCCCSCCRHHYSFVFSGSLGNLTMYRNGRPYAIGGRTSPALIGDPLIPNGITIPWHRIARHGTAIEWHHSQIPNNTTATQQQQQQQQQNTTPTLNAQHTTAPTPANARTHHWLRTRQIK